MQSIGFAAKVLALLVSFAGLCGMIRRWTKLDGTSAPLVTVSLITVVMMLGGGALYGIWWVLYLGGFLGFLWHYLIRRSKPDLTAVVTLGAALAFVCLRFPGAYFTGNDSVSHWGLAAKFLLRENRFPDGAQELIYFPSYPLGEGVYLYYVCRSLGSRPDLYMAGLFMLYVVALLPVMGLAGEKKPLGPVLGALTMIYLLCCNTFSLSLQVDALIGYLAIGGTLIVCREHDSPRKLAALGVIAMLTLVKTSGIFYAVVLAALLGLSSDKKTRLRSLLAGLGVAALTFALWQLHVKLNFGAVTGKHAVSVARYESVAQDKDLSLALSVALGLLRRVVAPGRRYAIYGLAALMALLVRRCAKAWRDEYRRAMRLALGTFALWFVMLFFTYIFTMSAADARALASENRYEETGMIYSVGVALCFAVAFCLRKEKERSLAERAAIGGAALLVAAAFFAFVPLGRDMASKLFGPSDIGRQEFAYILNLREKHEIEEGKSYLIFDRYHSDNLTTPMCAAKYELYSNDLTMLYNGYKPEENGPEVYYAITRDGITGQTVERIEDIAAFLEARMDGYDYVLEYTGDEAFEAAVDRVAAERHPHTQVVYAS